MQTRIGKRIIHCDNCVLALAIPTSRESFLECKRKAINRDFVPNQCSSVQNYEQKVLKIFNLIEAGVRSWGVTIEENLTFARFERLFTQFDIVILIAHWKDQSESESYIEFYDGLVPILKVVEGIPDSFSGVLDLCVCHPRDLAVLIRDRKPGCLVRLSENRPGSKDRYIAKPRYWLYYYLHLFSILHQGDYTYLEAYKVAYQKMMNREN